MSKVEVVTCDRCGATVENDPDTSSIPQGWYRIDWFMREDAASNAEFFDEDHADTHHLCPPCSQFIAQEAGLVRESLSTVQGGETQQ